ncbi:MAG: TIGR03546 family protein [Planctomycetes bacterium]|nr:TIGR03546 family protein [Planctomycetota bacterium]
MFRMLGSTAQRLLTEISQHRTPEQIAWGLAIGVSFGLVPMDSIISLLLLISILILPINHLCAATAFVAMVSVSRFIAPIPNALGLWILSHHWVANTLGVIYSLPIVPWLRLNNTMVVGGFCLGILSVAPNYITLRWLVRRTHSAIQQWSIDDVARQAPEFRKISSEKPTRSPNLSPSVTQRLTLDNPLDNLSANHVAANTPAGPTRASVPDDRQAITPSHPRVPTPNLRNAMPSQKHANRNSSETTIPSPGDMPAAPHTTAQRNKAPTKTSTVQSAPAANDGTNRVPGDTVLRETVIEVVRFRTPIENSATANPNSSGSSTNRLRDIPNDFNALSGPHLTTEAMNQELMIAEKNNSFSHTSLKTHTGSPVDPNTGAIQPPSPIGLGNHRQAITGHKGSDSLRYLLRHISGTKTEREGTDS